MVRIRPDRFPIAAPPVQQHLSADVVVFTLHAGSLHVLLVQRGSEPFMGKWALPGSFLQADESLDAAAMRSLGEKTGVTNLYLEQLFTFGAIDRDPRGRVVTTAYMGVMLAARMGPLTGEGIKLFPVTSLPSLAFDHAEIMQCALQRLRHKVNYTTIGGQLLEDRFTLSDMQGVYEIILGQRLDKRNFRKKMLQLGILKTTGKIRKEISGRPARLYTLARPGVRRLQERGVLIPF